MPAGDVHVFSKYLFKIEIGPRNSLEIIQR